MKRLTIVFLTFISTLVAACAYYPLTPSPEMSPGHVCTVVDKDFKNYRYPSKMIYCKRNVSTRFRKKIYAKYSIDWDKRKDYTIDHIIPLSIGGSNHFKNLWPEHISIRDARGSLEYDLYTQLKNGKITQKEAIRIILNSKFNKK